MAHTASSRALAVLVIALSGMAGCGQGGGGQPAAAPPAPATLPTGRLKLLRTGVEASRYLALDDQRPVNRGLEVTVLTVAKSPQGLEGGAGLVAERKQVRCAPQRVFDASAARFDSQGALLAQQAFSLTRHGRPATPDELELVQTICTPPPAAGAEVFDGWRSAQRDFQTTPDGYQATDGHGFAWLCADGARGGWRDSLPADCDKAVELNPGSVQVRLDRAYMNLKLARYGPAKRDFEAAVAADPQNPRALFGRGLAKAALGDEPGGKADRGQAIAIDAKILRWVEGTYRFTVGTGWRTG